MGLHAQFLHVECLNEVILQLNGYLLKESKKEYEPKDYFQSLSNPYQNTWKQHKSIACPENIIVTHDPNLNMAQHTD